MAKTKSKKLNAAARASANKRLAENRLARHQYEIIETLETGIELLGTEVKSIRAGKANLRDGFCLIRKGELLLHNVHISPHTQASSYFNHDPLRVRKLLAQVRKGGYLLKRVPVLFLCPVQPKRGSCFWRKMPLYHFVRMGVERLRGLIYLIIHAHGLKLKGMLVFLN